MHTTDRPATATGKREFLSFELGGLAYGVDLHKVKELRSLTSLERIAGDDGIVSGVAVSRGVIMPIVDMRVAFSSRAARGSRGTDVIILQLASCVLGMVVDGVTDVVRLDADQIRALPRSGGAQDGCDYLIGLGHADGRRLILVDIDKLMSIQRDGELQQAA